VTATDTSIRVGNGHAGATEDLGGLIELDSDVVSGDSGGPLFDDDGEVIGIVTAASSGAAVGGAVGDTPAAAAGIGAGSVITAVDGVEVLSADDLSAAIAAHDPGDEVRVDWTDSAGGQNSAAVNLGAGPA